MNMITRCPACETSFRITEAQLNTAKGAVRCGSCLHIFRAQENLISPRQEAKPASTAPAEQSATEKPSVAAAPRPVPEMPRFEYRRPAPVNIAPERKSAKPIPTRPAAAALSASASEQSVGADQNHDVEIAEPDDLPVAPAWQALSEAADGLDSEPESRLRFDQAAIDAEDDGEPDGLYADDLLISDELSLDEEETFSDTGTSASADFGDENFLSLDGFRPAEKSLFDRGPRSPKPMDDHDEDFDPDESWAMDLLEEEEEERAAAGAAQPRPEPAPVRSPFEDLANDDGQPTGEDVYRDYSPENTGNFAVAAEEDEASAEEAPAHKRRLGIWEDEEDAQQDESPLRAYRDADHDSFRDDLDHNRSRTAMLNRIEPEPVEFAIEQGRDWRQTSLWGGLSVLGLLVLIGQVAWLQFDQLSRQQPYRDVYSVLCPLVGCELPSLADPDLIRTSNLVVRSHPQAEGALMVDTILLNRASFEQPFPDLILTFSNIHGETLASRRFTPSEYLAGELAGRRAMPSNQPIHLSLEIVDPGPDAVNYSAYIPQ